MTQERSGQAHQADLDIRAEEGVRFELAGPDPSSGTGLCLATGPSIDAVRRVHARAGHPAAKTYEVPRTV